MSHNQTELLKKSLAERILILDGAMGTMIQKYKLTEADFRGERFKESAVDLRGNNDLLTLTQPLLISAIHEKYLQAGADIIETNTFSSTTIAQADYDLQSIAYELNFAGAKLARLAADKYSTPEKPRFVAGVLGPTNRTASISPDVNDPGFRNITFMELVDAYAEATKGLIEGGADLIMIETIFDTLNAKAAIFAIETVFEELGVELPIMISGTITDASGRTLSGQTTEAFYNSLRHAKPLTFGLNCALGPKELRQYVEQLSKISETYVSVHPNAVCCVRLVLRDGYFRISFKCRFCAELTRGEHHTVFQINHACFQVQHLGERYAHHLAAERFQNIRQLLHTLRVGAPGEPYIKGIAAHHHVAALQRTGCFYMKNFVGRIKFRHCRLNGCRFALAAGRRDL